ncbi:MAG: LysM peptidoglycan-binding domain-containing protein [Comamonas sp.]
MQAPHSFPILGSAVRAGASLTAFLLLGASAQAATPAAQLPVSSQQKATAQQVASQGVPLADLAASAPERYVVKPGDTLWDISRLYLSQPWRWPELWGMNLQAIANPHLIYPGQTLYLERRNGFARLSTAQPGGADEVIRVSPQARVLSLADSALPTINQRLIDTFMVEPEVLAEGEIERAPRLVAAAQTRTLLSPGDRVYARSSGGPALQTPGERELYRIFRKAVPMKDPETGAILGYEAQYLGRARLVRGESTLTSLDAKGNRMTDPVPATLDMVTVKAEVRIDDRLLPMPRSNFRSYVPHAPDESLQGSVVSIYGNDAVDTAAKNQVIAINRGTVNGIEPGHVFRLMTNGARIEDKTDADKTVIKLPNEYNGLAMVFRTFDRVSYALVLEAREGVRVGDALISPSYNP